MNITASTVQILGPCPKRLTPLRRDALPLQLSMHCELQLVQSTYRRANFQIIENYQPPPYYRDTQDKVGHFSTLN